MFVFVPIYLVQDIWARENTEYSKMRLAVQREVKCSSCKLSHTVTLNEMVAGRSDTKEGLVEKDLMRNS